jgi:hypothetical protein
MEVDPTDTPTVKPLCLHKAKQFVVGDHVRGRKGCQQREHLASVVDVSAGQLANYAWMDHDDSIV